jgi:hypothetical protein
MNAPDMRKPRTLWEFFLVEFARREFDQDGSIRLILFNWYVYIYRPPSPSGVGMGAV